MSVCLGGSGGALLAMASKHCKGTNVGLLVHRKLACSVNYRKRVKRLELASVPYEG